MVEELTSLLWDKFREENLDLDSVQSAVKDFTKQFLTERGVHGFTMEFGAGNDKIRIKPTSIHSAVKLDGFEYDPALCMSDVYYETVAFVYIYSKADDCIVRCAKKSTVKEIKLST